MEKDPQFSTMILVQPFPHHEFTSEECQKSLHALRLYPSTSLVVSKQSVGRASAAMETDPSHSTGSTTFPAPRSSRKVSFGREQIMAASSHTNRTAQGSGGHVLGYGGEATPPTSNPQSTAFASTEKQLHHHGFTTKEEENELMEIEESEQDKERVERFDSHSDESDSGSDDNDENVPGNHNRQLLPPPLRNIGLSPAFGRQRGRLPWGPRQFQGLGGGSNDDNDEIFEGEGHRLGGREVSPRLGDLQLGEMRMHNAARTAAIKRTTYIYYQDNWLLPGHTHPLPPSCAFLGEPLYQVSYIIQ